MEIKQWMEKMKDREKWRLIVGGGQGSPRAAEPTGRKEY